MRTELIPVMVSTLKMRHQYEVSKETKLQIAMRTIPIPVIVFTLEKRQKHEGLKDDTYEDGSSEAPKTTPYVL